MTFHSLETGGIGTRRLRYAVIASLLLHLLLLWPAAPRQLSDTAPALLHAALRPAPVSTQPPPPPRPAPRTVAPAIATPSAPIEPRALEPSRPASVPQTPVVSAEKALTPAPASSARTAAPSIPVQATAPGAVSATLISETTASGTVLDGLRGYRLAVASQARRFKRYPAQAMAAGWAGSAEIRLEVASDGQPRNVTVNRSSGHELLDRAAQVMIDAGAQRASVPESLRGRAFAVVLPVVFNLEGD
ncbi:MAG: TonB family protein [Betaproteobacteria bacterium]|nr:TonB family protein [Betaproteobacteria bacterium]